MVVGYLMMISFCCLQMWVESSCLGEIWGCWLVGAVVIVIRDG